MRKPARRPKHGQGPCGGQRGIGLFRSSIVLVGSMVRTDDGALTDVRHRVRVSTEFKSDIDTLEGRTGEFDVALPPCSPAGNCSAVHPRCWIDDPDPSAAEGVYPDARSVSRWHEDFFRESSGRTDRRKANETRVNTHHHCMQN
jgi:hypothetical protein